MKKFKENRVFRKGFTLVEAACAVVVLATIVSGVLVVMSRGLNTIIDTDTKAEAFRIARDKMEEILSNKTLSNSTDFGVSEVNPDIEWETVVEPFYEPITSRMWVRAQSKSTFTDRQGEQEEIQLVSWIASLTKKQVQQILAEQSREAEYLESDFELANNPEDLWDQVNVLMRTGDYDRAYMAMDKLVKEFPESEHAGKAPSVMWRMASHYAEMGQGDKMDVVLDELQEKFPESPEAVKPEPEVKPPPDDYEPEDKYDPDNNEKDGPPELDWSKVPPELIQLLKSLGLEVPAEYDV